MWKKLLHFLSCGQKAKEEPDDETWGNESVPTVWEHLSIIVIFLFWHSWLISVTSECCVLKKKKKKKIGGEYTDAHSLKIQQGNDKRVVVCSDKLCDSHRDTKRP